MDPNKDAALAEVRISEKGEEDVLMLIETNSRRDVLLSVLLFLAVIASTTCAGFFGPPIVHTARTRYTMNPDTGNVMHHSIPGVMPQNQFLAMKLAFEQANPTENEVLAKVSFNYLIRFQTGGQELRREEGSFSDVVRFGEKQEVSEEIPFFFDRFLSYDHVELRIDFMSFETVSDAVVIWQVGDVSHLKFQLWLKATFGIACVVSLVVFWLRLQAIERVNWTLEQWATLLLNAAAIVGINPLFMVYVYYPSLLQEMLNEFEERLFKSYVFLFILLVLDHLKHGKVGQCYYAPKLVFGVVLFFVEVLPVWVIPFGLEVTKHSIFLMLQSLRMLLDMVFLAWTGYIFYQTWVTVDPVERFVMYVYGFVFTVATLSSASEVLSPFLSGLVSETALFTLRFSSLYAFVLLMVFCHWPYEYNLDEVYDSPENVSDGNALMDSEG